MSSEQYTTIRVDSVEELDAFLATWGTGRIVNRRVVSDHVTDVEVESENGCRSRFRVHGDLSESAHPALRFGRPTIETLDMVMTAAAAFSAENPPHHPGTVARFPLPSKRYPGRVEIPLAVIARDGATPGLYAPPRAAVIDWPTAQPLGIGEFPGFHPENWPPPRLGNWPPEEVGQLSSRVVAASVARLSGCLGRLIDHAMAGSSTVDAEDIANARTLLMRLENPRMFLYYRQLNASFMDLLSL